MSKNAADYRERAMRCASAAALMRSEGFKQALLQLSRSWQSIALNLETAEYLHRVHKDYFPPRVVEFAPRAGEPKPLSQALHPARSDLSVPAEG